MRWAGETYEQWRLRVMGGVRCFAWLPTQMADGTWVWWEYYWSVAEPNCRGGFFWLKGCEIEDVRRPRPCGPPPKPSTK